jgi:hypothetical protein
MLHAHEKNWKTTLSQSLAKVAFCPFTEHIRTRLKNQENEERKAQMKCRKQKTRRSGFL